MGFLSGKKILVTGLLSDRSIAYGVAKAARREGAQLGFTYQNQRFRDPGSGLARGPGRETALRCVGGSDADIPPPAAALGARWDGLDGLVHAIAYAPRESI